MIRSMLIASVCLFAVPAYAQEFTASLSGAKEVPATDTKGSGTATVTLDGDKITYEMTYKDLTGPATAAHIHGPADPGANAGVAIPFKEAASPTKGAATLTAQQVADLRAGKDYVNIHTAKNPGGEIRGQLRKVGP